MKETFPISVFKESVKLRLFLVATIAQLPRVQLLSHPPFHPLVLSANAISFILFLGIAGHRFFSDCLSEANTAAVKKESRYFSATGGSFLNSQYRFDESRERILDLRALRYILDENLDSSQSDFRLNEITSPGALYLKLKDAIQYIITRFSLYNVLEEQERIFLLLFLHFLHVGFSVSTKPCGPDPAMSFNFNRDGHDGWAACDLGGAYIFESTRRPRERRSTTPRVHARITRHVVEMPSSRDSVAASRQCNPPIILNEPHGTRHRERANSRFHFLVL